VVGGTLPQALCAHSASVARISLTLEQRDESDLFMSDPLQQKIEDIRDDNKQAVQQINPLIGFSENSVRQLLSKQGCT